MKQTLEIKRLIGISVILAASLSVPVSAQNLVNNGDFDASTGGWSDFTDRFDWVSDDGAAPSGNGCAEQASTLLNGGTGITEQVFPVLPDTSYDLSASVKKPNGSLANAAWLMVQYLDSSHSYLGEEVDIYFPGNLDDGNWHPFTSNVVTPNYAAYVNYRLGVGTPSSGSGEAALRWDNVSFSQANQADAIFGDDFESGGTTNWSSATP